jgi:hypothetical protein
VLLALLVGFRHEVGGDWFNYLDNFDLLAGNSFANAIALGDPGYKLIEWLADRLGYGVHFVNLIGGSIFAFGLSRFCFSLPRPWLALSVSVPYLVIVLGMGYSRQGIALGCIMAGLVSLINQRTGSFVLWVIIGATFHKSAVMLLPMAALAAAKGRLWTGLWVGVVAGFAYVLLLQAEVDKLVSGYLDAQYQSDGALIRLIMNAVPAAVLLMLKNRFELPEGERRLWYWFSMLSLVALGMYAVSPSSTAVDRVALYLLPLQLVVMSRFPDAVSSRNGGRKIWVAGVVALYATVQFVWLVFSNYSSLWIPYRFFPLTLI